MAILAFLTAVVCPRWCALPAGHAPEHVDSFDGSAVVIHRAPVLADDPSGRRLDLAQAVTVHADGRVEASPPVVMVDGEHDHTLTADRARRHAAALVLAADILGGSAR